jgi:predicted O-methyltransferase YrrM
MHVFEWRVGGSTLFFSDRVSSVRSIESDHDWIARCTDAFENNQISNVTIEYHAATAEKQNGFADSSYVQSVCSGTYQLVAIDGVTDGRGSNRPVCFQVAESCIKPGGLIVVDDILMFPELIGQAKANEFRIFEGAGPCRPGVTQTAVFFY